MASVIFLASKLFGPSLIQVICPDGPVTCIKTMLTNQNSKASWTYWNEFDTDRVNRPIEQPWWPKRRGLEECCSPLSNGQDTPRSSPESRLAEPLGTFQRSRRSWFRHRKIDQGDERTLAACFARRKSWFLARILNLRMRNSKTTRDCTKKQSRTQAQPWNCQIRSEVEDGHRH